MMVRDHRDNPRMSIKQKERKVGVETLGGGGKESSPPRKTNPNLYFGVPFDEPSAGKFSHLASPSSTQACGTILNLFL